MLRDCKYRLPCAWCDKYDRPCLAVQYEVNKQEQEKNSKPPIECNHEWVFYKSIENTGGKCIHYRCSKCGAMMMRDSNNNVYESGEWSL